MWSKGHDTYPLPSSLPNFCSHALGRGVDFLLHQNNSAGPPPQKYKPNVHFDRSTMGNDLGAGSICVILERKTINHPDGLFVMCHIERRRKDLYMHLLV